MRSRNPKTPSYRLHKPSGQAVVTLNGQDFYLGRFDSPESREAYDRTIAQWLTGGRQNPCTSDLTINELIVRYLAWADRYYVKNGFPTKETVSIRYPLRPLRRLYGSTLAIEFGPLSLRAVRQTFIDADLCRNEVNRRTRTCVRLFKWAVGEGLIPAGVWHGLQAVQGLRYGRSEARETAPVLQVAEWIVEATLPYLASPVAALVRLMILSGARPGEATMMRGCDLDMRSNIWEYRPESHKTQHHGKDRVIFLGPQAQEIVREWLRTDLSAYLFSPRDSTEEILAEKRNARKSKLWPSHVKHQAAKRKKERKRAPGERYDAGSLRHAIHYAVTRANKSRAEQGLPEIPYWSPNQLRHTAATRLRREFGLDVARCILGHSSAETTVIYAEADMAKAAEAMAKMG